jgi:hypothetical protein
MFDTLKQQLGALHTLNPAEATQKNINTLKSIFGSTLQPKFDQGGVWIKVVKKNNTPYVATQLYYFWEHEGGINKYGLHVNEDVDVYAKAHDGGKSPEATRSYSDNKGAYNVSLFCGLQLPDPRLVISGHLIEFQAAMKRGSDACTSPSLHSAQPVGQVQSTQLVTQPLGAQQIGQTQLIPGTSPGSEGTAPGGHSAQPVGQTPVSQMGTQALGSQVGQTQYTSATGQGTPINLQLQVQNRNCTRSTKDCTAGQTCIYVNGSCFISCQ